MERSTCARIKDLALDDTNSKICTAVMD